MNPVSPKVANGAAAGGVTGAITVLLMYYLNKYGGTIPPEIAVAYTTLLTVPAGFLGGYLTKLENYGSTTTTTTTIDPSPPTQPNVVAVNPNPPNNPDPNPNQNPNP